MSPATPSCMIHTLVMMLCAACSATTSSAPPDKKALASGNTEQEATVCLENAGAARMPDKNAPERIELSHILVRHRELPRPQGADRSRGDACLRALLALEALAKGAQWDAVVEDFSDSKSSGGSLGRVSPGELSTNFANAAFALEVDELSYVVESDRGFHIILRTE